MADAADSKSVGRKAVWVRLPPPAYYLSWFELNDYGFYGLNSYGGGSAEVGCRTLSLERVRGLLNKQD